jgi:hypothetical protein
MPNVGMRAVIRRRPWLDDSIWQQWRFMGFLSLVKAGRNEVLLRFQVPHLSWSASLREHTSLFSFLALGRGGVHAILIKKILSGAPEQAVAELCISPVGPTDSSYSH